MYLRNLDEIEVQRLRQSVSSSPDASLFYENLKKGKYAIFFSYLPESQSLLYEALPKEDEEDYQGMLVTSYKEITDLKKDENPISNAFALYLHEKDSKRTPDELRTIYGSFYDQLYSVSELSQKDALDRKEQMPLFEAFEKELMEDDPETVKKTVAVSSAGEKLKLEYHITVNGYNDQDGFILKIKAGYDKPHALKSTYDFVQKAVLGGTVELGRNKLLDVSPDNLDAEDEEVLSLILSDGKMADKAYRYQDRNEILLQTKDLVSLCFALKGRIISFRDYDVLIDAEEKIPSISLDEKGNFRLTPDIQGDIYTYGNQGILVDFKAKEITLLSFTSSKEAKLYSFVTRHPNFRFDLFQNEVASEILPLLGNSVQVSDDYKEKHPYRKEEICYYVDYLENDTIRVKTKFYFGQDEVTEEAFQEKLINQKKVQDFHQALSELSFPSNGIVSDPELILRFLKADLFALKQTATVYLSENLSQKKVTRVGKINVRTKSGIDWLEVSLESESFTPDELNQILNAYKKKKKFIRLKNTFIDLEGEDNDEIKEFIDDFDLSSITSKKLPLYQVLKLPSYQGDDFDVAYSPEVKTMMEDIKNFKDKKLELEPDIEKEMRPYQLDGVRWMQTLVDHHLSGILADDMGLGKTLEMIALLSLSKESKPILAVCPKSLIYNWENEFTKWNPFQKVFVLDGDKTERLIKISQMNPKAKDVYITSYDSLRNDLDSFSSYDFSYLILDEGQNIANIYAKKTRAVKKIQADYHFVMTGTPIQNSLMDLWSIFDFLMPGYLSSYQDFHKTYGKMTLEDEDKKEDLMKKVRPFVLKRTKQEVLTDLPPKEEQIVTIAMNDEQRKIYDAYLQEARSTVDQGGNRIDVLAALTRLREICVDPSMFLEGFQSPSEKLVTALKMITDSIPNGHKILVFSAFAKTLTHFQSILKQNNLDSYLIYGGTDAKERIRMADDFNTRPDVKVMLVSLKAGGTGLNLIGADIVIHLDPWWNLAAETQASDRVHRIGQTKSVTIIKLVCKDSVEEKVIELQKKKKDLASVIQEGDEGITEINTDDLDFLLS